jgi:hypothetical protein
VITCAARSTVRCTSSSVQEWRFAGAVPVWYTGLQFI